MRRFFFLKTPLAWLQLAHEPVRLLIATLGVVFAVVLMMVQLGLQESLYDSSLMVHRSLRGDLFLMNARSNSLMSPQGFSRRQLAQTLSFPGVESIASISTLVSDWKNPVDGAKRSIFVIAADGREPFLDLPGVRDNWDRLFIPEAIFFDRNSRDDFGPISARFESGEIVSSELNARSVRVTGLFTMGPSFSANGNALLSQQNFQQLMDRPAGIIDLGVIGLRAGADPLPTRQAMQAMLGAGFKVMTREELIRLEIDYINREMSIGFIFQQGVVIGFLVGMVIVYQILFTDVSRHLPEYATLKAMGYTDGYLSGVVIKQSMILSVLGFLPGIALTWLVYAITADATKLPMALKPDITALVFGLTVLMCAVSGLLAIRKLREADPADVF